jgi:hypothetical protein
MSEAEGRPDLPRPWPEFLLLAMNRRPQPWLTNVLSRIADHKLFAEIAQNV